MALTYSDICSILLNRAYHIGFIDAHTGRVDGQEVAAYLWAAFVQMSPDFSSYATLVPYSMEDIVPEYVSVDALMRTAIENMTHDAYAAADIRPKV